MASSCDAKTETVKVSSVICAGDFGPLVLTILRKKSRGNAACFRYSEHRGQIVGFMLSFMPLSSQN